MNLPTIIGLGLGLGGIMMGYMMEGGQPASLINIPALIIVMCGTLAGTFISFGMDQLKTLPRFNARELALDMSEEAKAIEGCSEEEYEPWIDMHIRLKTLPKLFIKTITGSAPHPDHVVGQFVTMADKARREGLLALEGEAQNVDDQFLKKGLMLMIDGTDPELLRDILEIDIESLEHRHEENFKVLEAMGGFAPTAGIIGTVMGLITVLANLANPAELGHKIAGAFIATFYGVFTANIFFLPMGAKLKGMSKEEVYVRRMVMEGILSIQAGDNPRVVQEKLESYLSPKARGKSQAADEGGGQRAAA